MKNLIFTSIITFTFFTVKCQIECPTRLASKQEMEEGINLLKDMFDTIAHYETITLTGRAALSSREKSISLQKHNNKFRIYTLDTKSNSIDTGFSIENIDFNLLKDKFYKCLKIDLPKSVLMGADGYLYTLTYYSGSGSISITFNVPNADPERRGLTDFIELKDLMIDLCGIKDFIPKD